MFVKIKNWALRFAYWVKRQLGLLPVSSLQQLWENNEQAHKRLKLEWDKTQRQNELNPCELLEAHKAASGNIYYIYKTQAQMPYERFMQLGSLQIQLEFCFDNADNFNDALDKIKTELVDKENLQTAKAQFLEFLTRKKRLPSNFILQQMCALFMVRHDENPYYLDPAIQQQKIYELQTDSQLLGFFLTFCWEMWLIHLQRIMEKFHICKVISPQDLVHYSATQTIKENQQNAKSQTLKA